MPSEHDDLLRLLDRLIGQSPESEQNLRSIQHELGKLRFASDVTLCCAASLLWSLVIELADYISFAHEELVKGFGSEPRLEYRRPYEFIKDELAAYRRAVESNSLESIVSSWQQLVSRWSKFYKDDVSAILSKSASR